MFAKVRGVPAELRPRIVQRTIQAMGLGLKADCRVGTYSGGNKRKLSVRDLQHAIWSILSQANVIASNVYYTCIRSLREKQPQPRVFVA